MKYRVIKFMYTYNPRASYFLLQRKKHWWSMWKTLQWYDYNEEERAEQDLEIYQKGWKK